MAYNNLKRGKPDRFDDNTVLGNVAYEQPERDYTNIYATEVADRMQLEDWEPLGLSFTEVMALPFDVYYLIRERLARIKKINDQIKADADKKEKQETKHALFGKKNPKL